MDRSNLDRDAGTPTGGASRVLVEGMSCPNCVRHVAAAIERVPGVQGVSVSLETGVANIRWSADEPPNLLGVVQSLRQTGYSASVPEETDSPRGKSPWSPLAGWRFNMVVGAGVAIPLVAGEWFGGLGMNAAFRWTAFVLAFVVQVVCGARFYRGAWLQLRVGSANMDTLVALGSTTAFLYSSWVLLAGLPEHLYFMESVSILTLISIGHGLEGYASARASVALRSLMSLAPAQALRRSASGAFEPVPVTALVPGDIVELRPGDRVPVDGQVVEGEGAVDESMLTGEPRPVDKGPGATLYAGTSVLDSRMAVRATSVGEATALAHIVATVARAQTSRARIQRLGDRVSAVFVPVVIAVAALTGLWWGLAPETARRAQETLAPWLWHAPVAHGAWAAALMQAAGVLIVACPCAMGLATPAAIMSAANVAARRGILVRDGVALEKCGQIDTLLFDKTGTLTEGKLAVAAEEFYPAGGWTEDAIGRLRVAMAIPSRHPLSQALAGRSEAIRRGGDDPAPLGLAGRGPTPNADLRGWREHRGRGIEAKLGTEGSAMTIRLGSLAWLRESGVDTGAAEAFVARWSAQGATVPGLAAGGRLLAVMALQDTVKPEAEAAVAWLRRQGLRLYLVTGDSAATAQAIASRIGLPAENVLAENRPDQKAAVIERLQGMGARVAFVGDGINDAPALEQADLGIAVRQASDIAREAADVVLLRSDLRAVPEALRLAQSTLRVIRQNLFWAFFYNAAAVPLAALGFLSPVLCALAMGLSDLIVIGNALRLKWTRVAHAPISVPASSPRACSSRR